MAGKGGHSMRIGTWNVAGRWTDEHAALMLVQDCDVWLVTEVSHRLDLQGFTLHRTQADITKCRAWAGVLSRLPMAVLPDPHPASAMARIHGTTICSSVLPWRSCPSREPWVGDRHAAKTRAAVTQLREHLAPTSDLVWGGDWNHALAGREYAGSQGGRAAILELLADLELHAHTTDLPHNIDGLLSIDHIATSRRWQPVQATRIVAALEDRRLSDHDAYVIEVANPVDHSPVAQRQRGETTGAQR